MWKILMLITLMGLSTSYLLPDTSPRVIPVAGASAKDWHPRSFWYYPWGRSGTHKGIDIFARRGTPVLSSVHGWVWRTGFNHIGGHYVLILGAKWRFHYYAHLDSIQIESGRYIEAGQLIGSVGDSGNAKGKPPHLHYQINNTIPSDLFTEWDKPQGSIKAFYTDPSRFLQTATTNPVENYVIAK